MKQQEINLLHKLTICLLSSLVIGLVSLALLSDSSSSLTSAFQEIKGINDTTKVYCMAV